MNSILVCRPDHYQIEYEINPWMHIENRVNPVVAAKAHNQLCKIYTDLGIELKYIDQAADLPDMVYTANLGYAEGNTFIPANFRYKQRRGETELAVSYFKNLGYNIKRIPEKIFFEGEGDFLKIGDHYLLGYGKRSKRQAGQYLEEILNDKVYTLELVNPYFYHLDTAIGRVSNSTVVINPQSFTAKGKKQIYSLFDNIIEINKQDASVIAANMVSIGNNIIMGSGISKTLNSKLTQLGFNLHLIDMKEFLKGGGSVKCCSLFLN